MTKWTRALLLLVGAYFVGLFVYLCAARLFYPYDLEWMEGGTLCHSLRLLEQRPLYAPPSVDFIPFLYTPGYPALLALLARPFGLGYALARALSLFGLFLVLFFTYVFSRREGHSRSAAFAGVALILAAYVPTGAWYDIARPDSLFMGVTVAALIVGWWGRHRLLGGIAAGLLMVAAFYVKQTATLFMPALGLALLLVSTRVALAYAATLALVGLPALWLSNQASHGWFWTYVSVLHRKHAFFPVRAFLGAPGRLLLILGPGLLLVPWALARRRTPGLVYATLLGLAGVFASGTSYGTQWAHINAFFPGVMLPAIAIAVAAGRLLDCREGPPPRRRPPLVYLALTASLLCAPGGLQPLVMRVLPPSWDRYALDRPTGYLPRSVLPTASARSAGDVLVARLRLTPGEVFIPFHPYYARLAGKRTFVHRMGVMDIAGAGLPPPNGLQRAFADRRFGLIVLDRIEEYLWPQLMPAYRLTETIQGPPVFVGAPTVPRYLLVPSAPTGVAIDQELQ